MAIGKWFDRRLALPPQVEDALGELTKLAEQKPSLAISCKVLQDILPELFGNEITESPPAVDPIQAREKLTQGTPLLRGVTLTLDNKSWRRRWLAICKTVAKHQNREARAVADAYAALEPARLLAEVLVGRPESVHAKADSLNLDAALTATVLRLSVFPVLAKFAAAFQTSNVLETSKVSAWSHGCCPMCGSWPLLGELRGLEQIRFLRCGLCASEWQFPRLRCPLCDNADHRKLGFFYVEGEENRCRAATCDACHGYVKTISTLSALSAPTLLVTDLATLHLDLAAADRGFMVR